jgi:hypothetical protein
MWVMISPGERAGVRADVIPIAAPCLWQRRVIGGVFPGTHATRDTGLSIR